MGVLAVAGYVISVGNVFNLNWQTMANIGILAVLTGLVSLIKTALTNTNGVFAGAVRVK